MISITSDLFSCCSVHWSGQFPILFYCLVQRGFLSYILQGQLVLNYLALKSYLKLFPFATRRQHRDIKFIYKHFNNQTDYTLLLSKTNIQVLNRGTRSQNLIYLPFHRTNYAYYSCKSRMLGLANGSVTGIV